MDDLWLFLPDADRATGLEELTQEAARAGTTLICCAANPEVEAWLLAGHRQQLAIPWSAVVSHPRLKEDVFKPFLASHGNAAQPGGGRESLMLESLANYRGLLSVCPELAELESKIRRVL